MADLSITPLWREVAGPGISGHTKPVQLQRGCLLVCVDSSAWKMELDRHYKDRILNKLGAKDPRIKSIRFQVGQI